MGVTSTHPAHVYQQRIPYAAGNRLRCSPDQGESHDDRSPFRPHHRGSRRRRGPHSCGLLDGDQGEGHRFVDLGVLGCQSSSAAAAPAAGDLVGSGCAAYAQKVPSGPGSVAGMAKDPVATAASNSPVLTTLTGALSGKLNPDVNLVETLNNGQFTVFAPTDEAFGKGRPGHHREAQDRFGAADLGADLSRGSGAGGPVTGRR